MTSCVFCQIIAGDLAATVVYQDEHILAFWDQAPKAPVHLLVVPRKHIKNLDDLQVGDETLISHLMMKIPDIARNNKLSGGYRTLTNTGRGGHQEIYHMHFHLLGGGELPAL
ncbi:MAG: histidine triad nucleotide-binding protein [Pontibacterium sp.]